VVLFFTHIPFLVNHTFNATPAERLQHHVNIRCLRLGSQDVHQTQISVTLEKVWNHWLIKQYAIIVRSRLINTHIQIHYIFIQLYFSFLSIANALHGSLALTLSIKNFGVYPISLLGDLCDVDYSVQIAVLTTKYEYMQHKYTK